MDIKDLKFAILTDGDRIARVGSSNGKAIYATKLAAEKRLSIEKECYPSHAKSHRIVKVFYEELGES